MKISKDNKHNQRGLNPFHCNENKFLESNFLNLSLRLFLSLSHQFCSISHNINVKRFFLWLSKKIVCGFAQKTEKNERRKMHIEDNECLRKKD